MQHEAQAASALNHPNVYTIHEIGEQNGKTFVVIENLDGQRLRHLIAGRPIEMEQLFTVAIGCSYRHKGVGMTIPNGTESARPFLPAKDFESSKSFYEALGFRKLLDGDVAIFGVGESAFILTRSYREEWRGNYMMQLMVDDLDEWWAHIEALDLPHSS